MRILVLVAPMFSFNFLPLMLTVGSLPLHWPRHEDCCTESPSFICAIFSRELKSSRAPFLAQALPVQTSVSTSPRSSRRCSNSMSFSFLANLSNFFFSFLLLRSSSSFELELELELLSASPPSKTFFAFTSSLSTFRKCPAALSNLSNLFLTDVKLLSRSPIKPPKLPSSTHLTRGALRHTGTAPFLTPSIPTPPATNPTQFIFTNPLFLLFKQVQARTSQKHAEHEHYLHRNS
mmetsp:Transcript_11696/g.48637  ORF Transcript_11696/g.48637 Transcript_11696/m.48637 type:complete len:234 (-) Transcript_11696:39-740(-)